MGEYYTKAEAKEVCWGFFAKYHSLPKDPVDFSNRFFPVNPDVNRPDMGPDLPVLSENWLRFMDGRLGYNPKTQKFFKIPEKQWKDNKNNAIIGPPGYTKTLVMERYVLWLLARNPNIRGVYASRTAGKAIEFVGAIKRRIENEDFIEAYGDLKDLTLWGNSKFRLKRSIESKDSTLVGVGIGSQLEATRLDFAILDDLTDIRTKDSDAEKKKVMGWLKETLIPRLDPGAPISFIGSRWDLNDICMVVKNMPMFKGRVIEVRAEIRPGKSLSEVIFPSSELMKKKENIGSTSFDLRYNGIAGDIGRAIFPTPMTIDRYKLTDIGVWKRFAALDFNASEKDKSDLTALVLGCVVVDNSVIKLVIDSVYTTQIRRNYEQWVNKCLNKCMRNAPGLPPLPLPIKIWAESIGFQLAIVDQVDRGVSFDIDVVPLNLVAKKDPRKINLDSLSKYERIKTVIQGKLETGRLMVLKDSDNPGEGCSDLIMNIEQYPDIWHDDPIDAAQMLTRMVFSEIGRGQTRRRLPKPGY